MTGGDIATVVATCLSGVALIVSGCALTYSRRSARAAEDAVTEARRSADATETNVRLVEQGLDVSKRGLASSLAPKFDLVLAVAPKRTSDDEGASLEWTATMTSGQPLVHVTAVYTALIISGSYDQPTQERVTLDVSGRQMTHHESLFAVYPWRGGPVLAMSVDVTLTCVDQSPSPLRDETGEPWTWTEKEKAGWSKVISSGLKIQGLGADQ